MANTWLSFAHFEYNRVKHKKTICASCLCFSVDFCHLCYPLNVLMLWKKKNMKHKSVIQQINKRKKYFLIYSWKWIFTSGNLVLQIIYVPILARLRTSATCVIIQARTRVHWYDIWGHIMESVRSSVWFVSLPLRQRLTVKDMSGKNLHVPIFHFLHHAQKKEKQFCCDIWGSSQLGNYWGCLYQIIVFQMLGLL